MFFSDIESLFKSTYAEVCDDTSMDGNGTPLLEAICRILSMSFRDRTIIRSLDSTDPDEVVHTFDYGMSELDSIIIDYYRMVELRDNYSDRKVVGMNTSVLENTPNDMQVPFISPNSVRSINTRSTGRSEVGVVGFVKELTSLRMNFSDKVRKLFAYAFENQVA